MNIAGNQPSDTAVGPVGLDQSLWLAFANARTDTAFLSGWLALVVARVPDAVSGVLLEADHDAGAFVARSVVPDPRRDLSGFRAVAERAMASRRPAIATDDGLTRIAWPVTTGAAPVAMVAVLELGSGDSRAGAAALRDLHWGSGWLAARLWERQARQEGQRVKRSALALDLVAVAGEHAKVEAAAMALVNELQNALNCDRVTMGMLKGRRTAPRIRLLAVSHAAWFRKRSTLAERIEAAMEECFDQAASVAFPPIADAGPAITVAHADHVQAGGARHMITAPMLDESGPVGAVCLERREDRPFSPDDLLMAETAAALLGPVMEVKRRNRRWFGGRIVDGTLHGLGVLLGPRRLSWKLLALALMALTVAAATITGPFRLKADAVLRGEVQRAAVAPFAGYIRTGPLRAGDRVEEGAVLARLDDTDLRLEELRWQSEIDRLIAQSRSALAQYDRTEVALLEAQIEQARARLDLTRARLARTEIRAPIAGLIVMGDLSQRLGAPVQEGEVLFEIARLDTWRIDLYLDERDLRHVALDQGGRIALTGQPDSDLPFDLTRITPVAELRDGVNTFRLEAALAGDPAGLRPGMTGVARIDAGEALLAWIWTRRLLDWMRQTLWTWQP